MSVLIDDLRDPNKYCEGKEINGKWYAAKPIIYWSTKNIIDAFKVLIGKAFAYHYKEDV
jgi:hypothetical protein